MIRGLYAAVSSMLANLARQRALSHNISNLDTPGFKQVLVSLEDYIEVPVAKPNIHNQLAILGDLGLGVEARPETTDFSPGGLLFTGQLLDMAIDGEGFFRVETPDGERYTRDGRFVRDADNQLVTIDGYAVLDDAGRSISLQDGVVSISPEGIISVDGTTVAQMGLAAFEDPAEELVRDLPNAFEAEGAPTGTDPGSVRQGYLEGSNANPAQLMTQMVEVSRAYEAAQQMVVIQDELLGRTISSLGRL